MDKLKMNIIELAKEAGFTVVGEGTEGWGVFEARRERLERFAALVRAEEREKFKSYVEEVSVERDAAIRNARAEALEEAAKVCEGLQIKEPYHDWHHAKNDSYEHCAAVIRGLK